MRKYITLLFASMCILLNSCVKEKHRLEVNDNTTRVITEFPDGNDTTLYPLVLDYATGLVEVDLTEIRLGSRSNVTGNVEVKIRLNPGLVDDYNAATGSTYEIPPAGIFDVPSYTFTLTPTSRSAVVKIKVDPSAVIGNSYAQGLSIFEVSTGEINELRKNIIVELKVKNIYDGEYTSNGYLYHPTLPREIIELPKTLTTVNATSVECELGDLGPNGYVAVFEVNPSTNDVTITPAVDAVGGPYTMFTTGLPSSNPGYTPQWPRAAECNNVYDPVQKEFKVRYGYLGASGWRVTEEVIKAN